MVRIDDHGAARAQRSPIETDQICHGTNRKVHHEIHAAIVEVVDDILPVSEGAPMRVENRKVKRRVTCANTTRELPILY